MTSHVFTSNTELEISDSIAVDSNKDHTFVMSFSDLSGKASDIQIGIKGSLDEEVWFDLYSCVFTAQDLLNGYHVFHDTGKVFDFIKIEMTKLTTTGAAEVSVNYSGRR